MSEGATDVIDVALLVGDALDRVGAPYFVGGSVASSLQGEPRSTNDIDIVVQLPPARVALFRDELGSGFEVDVDMLVGALRSGSSANIFYLPWFTKIDIFPVGRSAYDESEFRRKAPVVVKGEASLVVKSVEDTVLRKLLWYREGGAVSDRQWRDIVGVLRVSVDQADTRYLSDWAARLGLQDLLAKARAEASVR